MSLQQRNVSGVQLLSGHQELHSDPGGLRLHPAAGDHRGLHHAVARHRSAAEESKFVTAVRTTLLQKKCGVSVFPLPL